MPVWVGRSSSWLCSAMLSASNSFIATNCWLLILLASFAPIRGSDDDRMMAPSVGGLGEMGNDGLAVLAANELLISAAAVALVMVWAPGEITASSTRAVGGGMTPRGDMEPKENIQCIYSTMLGSRADKAWLWLQRLC